MFKQFSVILMVLTAGLLSACAGGSIPAEQLFPAEVGTFFRTDGPEPDPAAEGIDVANYQGPEGAVTLKSGQIGEANVPAALSVLPGTAADIGPDDALGPRQGVFFTFANEYHAAWGNGDWIFILSASSAEARSAFLVSYGF